MLKRLLQVFAAPTEQTVAESQRIPLAAAVLLLEVAHADGEFHAVEEELISTLLSERFAVAPELQAELPELANQQRNDSSGLHEYTREINAAFTQVEKEQIIEAIWQLVYADGRLDCYEEALMRQLGSLIGLSHRQLIEAKLRVAKP